MAGAVPLADRYWKIGITGFLYALLFREELARLFDLWQTPRESHGWIIPAFSLYFVYQSRGLLRKVVGKGSFWGLAVMVGSLWIYLYFGAFQGFYYVRQLMMITLLAGVVLQLGGWAVLRIVWLPVVFLLFALPLPPYLYNLATMPLRELASAVAAAILNVLPGVDCESSGVLIHGVRNNNFFSLNVAEACSGMRLLLAFLALGVAMAYLEYRPVLHRVVLLCSTIPIAVLCNMLRVFLTGLIHIYVGEQYTQGMLHTILGLGMLLVAFGLYGLLAWIMNQMFLEEDTGGILVVQQKKEPT